MADAHETWSVLVAKRRAALERWHQTAAMLEVLPAAAEFEGEEGRAHEEARIKLDACEDRLLETLAPDLAGVVLQLELFAQRFHCADLDEPMSGEDVLEADVLRRIRQALVSAAGAPSC